jgi:hypothetical protein
MQRAICCRIFTPAARPEYPAASLRDYCCGVLTESDESEDIVVEGEKFEEQEELEKARADSLHLLGGRLVKGQKP